MGISFDQSKTSYAEACVKLNGSLTLSLWAKPTDIQTRQTMLQLDGRAKDSMFLLKIDGGKIRAIQTDGLQVQAVSLDCFQVPLDWVWLSLVLDRGSFALACNGDKYASKIFISENKWDWMYIGVNVEDDAYIVEPFSGAIDDMKIEAGARTQSEIAQTCKLHADMHNDSCSSDTDCRQKHDNNDVYNKTFNSITYSHNRKLTTKLFHANADCQNDDNA